MVHNICLKLMCIDFSEMLCLRVKCTLRKSSYAFIHWAVLVKSRAGLKLQLNSAAVFKTLIRPCTMTELKLRTVLWKLFHFGLFSVEGSKNVFTFEYIQTRLLVQTSVVLKTTRLAWNQNTLRPRRDQTNVLLKVKAKTKISCDQDHPKLFSLWALI